MKKRITRLFSLMLTLVLMIGTLPVTAKAGIGTDSLGYTTFTSFSDLQELVSQEYNESTSVRYAGSGTLVIEDNLVLPENFHLYFLNGEILIPSNVTVTATFLSGIACDKLRIEGTLNLEDFSSTNIYESLIVTGILNCAGSIYIHNRNPELVGIENITVTGYGEISISHDIRSESDLQDACAVAAADTRPGFVHYFNVRNPLTIQHHVVTPQNSFLLIEYTFKIETSGTLECLGDFTIRAPMIVYGTLINDSYDHVLIVPSDRVMLEISADAVYGGEGGFTISGSNAYGVISGIDLKNYTATELDGSWYYDYTGSQPSEPPVVLPTITGTYTTDLVMPAADLGVSAPDSILRATLTFTEDGKASASWEAVDLTAFKVFFHDMFVNSYYAMAYGAGITDINEIEQFCMDSTGMSVSAYMDTIVTDEAMKQAFTPPSTAGTYTYAPDQSAIYTDLPIMEVPSDPAVPNSFVVGDGTMYLNAASWGKPDYTFVCKK